MTGSRCITQTCTVRLRKSSPSRNTENIINEEKHQLMYSLTAEVRHATELDTVALLFLSCPSAPNRSVGGERGAAAAARQFPSCPTVQAHCSAQQVLDSSHSVFNTIITLIYQVSMPCVISAPQNFPSLLLTQYHASIVLLLQFQPTAVSLSTNTQEHEFPVTIIHATPPITSFRPQ